MQVLYPNCAETPAGAGMQSGDSEAFLNPAIVVVQPAGEQQEPTEGAA